MIKIGLNRKIASIALEHTAWLALSKADKKKSIQDVKSVLVLEPFGMGDMINLLPMLELINNEIDGVQIFVAGKTAWKDLFSDDLIKEYIPFHAPWSNYDPATKYSIPKYFSDNFKEFVKSATNRRFDIGIDPRGDIRSVILLRHIGCANVYSKKRYVSTDLRMRGILTTNAIEINRFPVYAGNSELFAGILGKQPLIKPPSLVHLKENKTESHVCDVLIHPAAPWKWKLWSGDKWREIAKLLRSSGLCVKTLCGPDEHEYIDSIFPVDKYEIISFQNIRELTASLQKCRCFICLDSGPMHAAAALDIPTVALFGPADIQMWLPLADHVKGVKAKTKIDCSPCHQIGCANNGKCMEDIEVDDVLAKTLELLGRPSS